MGDASPQPTGKFVGQFLTRFDIVDQLHRGCDRLAHHVIRHTEDRRVDDQRMPDEFILDLLRVDVDPGPR